MLDFFTTNYPHNLQVNCLHLDHFLSFYSCYQFTDEGFFALTEVLGGLRSLNTIDLDFSGYIIDIKKLLIGI